MVKIQTCQGLEASGKEKVQWSPGDIRQQEKSHRIIVCKEGSDETTAKQSLNKLLQLKGGGNACGLLTGHRFPHQFKCEKVEKKDEVFSYQKMPPLKKNIFYHVWATHCGHCKVELPKLIEFAKRLEAKGVQVVIVADEYGAEDMVRAAEIYKKSGGTDIPIIGISKEAEQRFGKPSALPYSVVEVNGVTLRRKAGAMNELSMQNLEKQVDEELKKKNK